MIEELENHIESKQYSQEKERLRSIIEDINYHRQKFPESFEINFSLAVREIEADKINILNKMYDSSWNFNLIVGNIESYYGFEFDLIAETNSLLELCFGELLDADYLFCFASEGIKNWAEILNIRISNNLSHFKYYLKEMKYSELELEATTALAIEECLSTQTELDGDCFLDLLLKDNYNMGNAILRLQIVPSILSKYFDTPFDQQIEARLCFLQENSFPPTKFID